jgi:hypothetical protein
MSNISHIFHISYHSHSTVDSPHTRRHHNTPWISLLFLPKPSSCAIVAIVLIEPILTNIDCPSQNPCHPLKPLQSANIPVVQKTSNHTHRILWSQNTVRSHRLISHASGPILSILSIVSIVLFRLIGIIGFIVSILHIVTNIDCSSQNSYHHLNCRPSPNLHVVKNPQILSSASYVLKTQFEPISSYMTHPRLFYLSNLLYLSY